MDGGSPWWQDEHLGEMRRAAGAVNTIPAAKPHSVVMSEVHCVVPAEPHSAMLTGVRCVVPAEPHSAMQTGVYRVVTERMTRH